MLAIVYVSLYVASLLCISILLRVTYEPSAAILQPYYFGVVLFCSINALIAKWELSLWWYHKKVESLYQGYKKKLKRSELPSPIFLFREVPLRDALTFEFWADVWGTYSLLDVSYSQTGSFGYNIDVGNGWTTLFPSLALIWVASGGTFVHYVSPRLVGFLSGLIMWQQCYGTLLYFLQYVVNKRWQDHGTPISQMVFLVGGSNVIWIVGPVLCLWTCWQMVVTDSIQIFL